MTRQIMRSDGSLLIEQFFLKFIILFFLFIALARLSLTLSEILDFLQVFRNICILIWVLKFLKLAQQSFIGCILRFFIHPRNFTPSLQFAIALWRKRFTSLQPFPNFELSRNPETFNFSFARVKSLRSSFHFGSLQIFVPDPEFPVTLQAFKLSPDPRNFSN